MLQIWRVCREGALAETADAGQDTVGRFGPAERPRLGVVPLDLGQHRRLQLLNRAVDAALELPRGKEREEAQLRCRIPSLWYPRFAVRKTYRFAMPPFYGTAIP